MLFLKKLIMAVEIITGESIEDIIPFNLGSEDPDDNMTTPEEDLFALFGEMVDLDNFLTLLEGGRAQSQNLLEG
jgi:hypothetical protein